MMYSSIKRSTLYSLFLFCTPLFIFIHGCASKSGGNTLSDKPLTAFQKELLDIAFKTATAIPAEPHLKDRSKAQQGVVDACLKLDQPKRAVAYIEKIDDWRQGLCYANLALYCAKSGHNKQARQYLEFAGKISKEDFGQAWRNNSIIAVIIQARTLLGQTEKVSDLKHDLADSNSDKNAQAVSKVDTEASFDEQVKMLDSLIEVGEFYGVKYALQVYTRLFDRFYDENDKRTLTEEKIKTSWNKVPVSIRLELLFDMADFALKHSDPNKAIKLADEVQIFIDEGQWPLEYRIPTTAKLCELLFKAGDSEKSRDEADAALALFNAQKDKIINIYRAETICPLGQAYKLMSDTTAALSVYKLAIEEGTLNPNSRPRAEDLSATCCSMALYTVEPDSELWTRIHQISEGLGKPW